MMKVSVIILCHNNIHIVKVIRAVLAQIDADDELFVVDDYSNETTKSQLNQIKDDRLIILIPPKKGNRAANRNYAANCSTGDLLVFIDGDVLIEDLSINKIKLYNYESVSGLCGSVAAMRMTPEMVAIACKKYSEILDPDTLNFHMWHEKFPDIRNSYDDLPWNRFYTAFSIIPKSKFFEAGMFDEVFLGWGGEDIDIGYRLSKIGSLKISIDIRGIHIPHDRNISQEEKNARKNMYLMLSKYRNRDMEELLSFAMAPSVTQAIDTVLSILSDFSDVNLILPSSPEELVYYSISKENPKGKIAYYSEGNIRREEFLGFALPFYDSFFAQSTTTTDIFDYPEGMATRILQELLRVSRKIVIIKSLSRSIKWGTIEDKFRYVFCYYKTYQFSDSFEDFSIVDCGKYYVIS